MLLIDFYNAFYRNCCQPICSCDEMDTSFFSAVFGAEEGDRSALYIHLLVVFVFCNMLALKACEILPVIFRCASSYVRSIIYPVGKNVASAGQISLCTHSHAVSSC